MAELSSFRELSVPPVTTLTIAALVVIFLVHELTGEFKAERHTVRPEHSVEPDKWYRFFTSPLVHANLFYLLLSTVGLLVLGSRLERKLGTMLFLYTQTMAWLGTVLTFVLLGSILYFISDYSSWLEAKHTGFGPILFCYAVIDSYIGKRDIIRILAPWLLVPIIPLALHRVSILSVFAGSCFGFLLTRGGLGRTLMPSRDYLVRSEQTFAGRLLSGMSKSFCPVWPESSTPPFTESTEGSSCSDLHPNQTYEQIKLIPMSSKETAVTSSVPASQAASVV